MRSYPTQRHRYTSFSKRSPFRFIILCLCIILASIIFMGFFFLYPNVASRTSSKSHEAFYRTLSNKTITVLHAMSIKYRADMTDYLQLPDRNVPMVSLIEDAVNLTFDRTTNPSTDTNREFYWTPTEATALRALKSGDYFPPFIPRSIDQNSTRSSSAESRMKYSATTNVLCTTFAPLRRNAFSSIMDKLFANQALSMSEHESKKMHHRSHNSSVGMCDWLVLFYEGDQILLSELQENIRQIMLSTGSNRRIRLKWMDRSITQKIAYQQLIQYSRRHMQNDRVTVKGMVGNVYKRFTPNSPSTPSSNMPYNVYVHSKLFLYLGLLDRYEDLLSSPTVDREHDTNPPSSQSLPLLRHYSHIWLIDHDINLTGFNLTTYLHTLQTARFPSAPDVPCTRNDLLFPSMTSSVVVSQPLLYEKTQIYKYFHSDAWKAEEQKMQNRPLFSFKPPTKTSSHTKIIAAETRFIEIQAPLFDAYFFHWFLRYFVVPLLGASHVLGADWGLDALFCTAASVYRKEYIAYTSMQRDIEVEKQKGLLGMKTSTTSSSSSSMGDIHSYMNDIQAYHQGLGEVVCAVIMTGHPLHHINTKTMDHLYHITPQINPQTTVTEVTTGKRSKELLNHAMMAIIAMAFPHFYLSGSLKKIDPLINHDMRRILDEHLTVEHNVASHAYKKEKR